MFGMREDTTQALQGGFWNEEIKLEPGQQRVSAICVFEGQAR